MKVGWRARALAPVGLLKGLIKGNPEKMLDERGETETPQG
jgi:hypothetical protein